MAVFRLGSQPFFDDKNRAFWVLQSAGWTGYLVLRSLGGLANNMGLLFVLPTALTTWTSIRLPEPAPAAVTSLDTTPQKLITVGATWGTSSGSNTITCHDMRVTVDG